LKKKGRKINEREKEITVKIDEKGYPTNLPPWMKFNFSLYEDYDGDESQVHEDLNYENERQWPDNGKGGGKN